MVTPSPSTLRAMAPAATRIAVSRAELRPPPRWSRMPYFISYVMSAWPGRNCWAMAP